MSTAYLPRSCKAIRVWFGTGEPKLVDVGRERQTVIARASKEMGAFAPIVRE
jgi:hypothetical protein